LLRVKELFLPHLPDRLLLLAEFSLGQWDRSIHGYTIFLHHLKDFLFGREEDSGAVYDHSFLEALEACVPDER